ncbi:MAG: MAPEG family protein [Xanthobacteraceae bacterium]|nr:MAPEG family protein [Xanthobacteraceae bacterium]
MHLPSITAIYLAILALLYVGLAIHVARLRQRDRAAFGDNGSRELRSAIRAHANFVEYVPIITLMVAMLEMSGLPAMRVHVLMGALLVSRLLHPLGMYAAPNTLQFRVGRVGGITITFVLLIACAVQLLLRLL